MNLKPPQFCLSLHFFCPVLPSSFPLAKKVQENQTKIKQKWYVKISSTLGEKKKKWLRGREQYDTPRAPGLCWHLVSKGVCVPSQVQRCLWALSLSLITRLNGQSFDLWPRGRGSLHGLNEEGKAQTVMWTYFIHEKCHENNKLCREKGGSHRAPTPPYLNPHNTSWHWNYKEVTEKLLAVAKTDSVFKIVKTSETEGQVTQKSPFKFGESGILKLWEFGSMEWTWEAFHCYGSLLKFCHSAVWPRLHWTVGLNLNICYLWSQRLQIQDFQKAVFFGCIQEIGKQDFHRHRKRIDQHSKWLMWHKAGEKETF